MFKAILFIISASIFINSAYCQESRDPLKWPFASNSIWNMPIGSNAEYVHAGIERAVAMGMTIDEDIIVMNGSNEIVEIYENFEGWDRTKDRCIPEGKFLFSAPIPHDFIVSKDTWDGLTPNSGLAVLMPDGETIRQTQPFAHCQPDHIATSWTNPAPENIYGAGMYGAHGGSGLSAIGGALRIHELMPESGPIRHVLKINLFGKRNFYYDEETCGYRWPAVRADRYAPGNYGSQRKSASVKDCRMGALLALPANMNLDSLGFETTPGRTLAEAFQRYGAYIVDDTAWDVYAIVTEWSPEDRFTEEFKKNWGLSFVQQSKNHPWSRDMDRIFLNLHVVKNNSENRIGGGGEPLAPLAQPIN